MAAPSIQIYYNDQRVKIAWEIDHVGIYGSFNLYWSASSTMAGELLVKAGIPNVDSSFYGKNQVFYEFDRTILGLTTSSEFYLRLKGVSPAGVVDVANPGATRLIPSLLTNREEFHAAQIYGYDYTKNLWKKLAVGDTGSLAVDVSPLFTSKSILTVFTAQALQNAWQYSSTVAVAGFGQAVLYMNYTRGAGDGTYEMQVEFSTDGTNWYQASYDTLVGGVLTSMPRLYNYTSSVVHRLAIPLDDNYMRVGIYATGAGPFGTVTASLTLGWN